MRRSSRWYLTRQLLIVVSEAEGQTARMRGRGRGQLNAASQSIRPGASLAPTRMATANRFDAGGRAETWQSRRVSHRKTVKHCARLCGTFDCGNRHGVRAKRPQNRPLDNRREREKGKAISQATVWFGETELDTYVDIALGKWVRSHPPTRDGFEVCRVAGTSYHYIHT